MITSQPVEGIYHGCNHSRTHSLRRHIRQTSDYARTLNFVWPWMLDNVGSGMGACLGTSHLCSFRVSFSNRKGEE